MFQWAHFRGLAESGGDIDSISYRVDDLKEKLDELKRQEDELDQHCKIMTENLKQARNDPANQYYSYVTRDDLVSVFGNEDVVLTVRNYDSCDSSPPEDTKRKTLRLYGRWKSIDVRLVTNEGESLRSSINLDRALVENEQNGSAATGVSSSQPSKGSEAMAPTNKRRTRRRKRHIVKEDDDEDDILTTATTNEDETKGEIDERLATAQALLGFRPSRKHLKRNLDEVSDSFECR